MTSKIEWLRSADGKPGYTINPVKGLCPIGCPYCYARRMYKRFKWNPEIRYRNDEFFMLPGRDHPKKIFVGSTMELFGDWIKPEWMQDIMDFVKIFPWHTFIFLTKKPENLIKYSPFPANCWVGVSATNQEQLIDAYNGLWKVRATVKFLSLEPLQEALNGGECEGKRLSGLKKAGINWVICGAQTPLSVKTNPQITWVKEIVDAADWAGVPVFLKNNLIYLLHKAEGSFYLPDWAEDKVKDIRQEMPAAEKEASRE
jgi:protein gp37